MTAGRPPLLKLISALLIAVVAFSAQAWASHVDWPTADGGSHVETTALDGASTAASASDADAVEHGDHCGHASAHLVGLHACHAVLAMGVAAAHDDNRDARYESVIHAPLIDPPIA